MIHEFKNGRRVDIPWVDEEVQDAFEVPRTAGAVALEIDSDGRVLEPMPLSNSEYMEALGKLAVVKESSGGDPQKILDSSRILHKPVSTAHQIVPDAADFVSRNGAKG
tara:strand:+ start:3913 stop:4236 length:324 start_codon:yes stop_codon:yes gene_type:complete